MLELTPACPTPNLPMVPPSKQNQVAVAVLLREFAEASTIEEFAQYEARCDRNTN